jgi:hypothetical protein
VPVSRLAVTALRALAMQRWLVGNNARRPAIACMITLSVMAVVDWFSAAAYSPRLHSDVAMVPGSGLEFRPPSPQHLRYDWSRLAPLSTMARRVHQHQSDCSKPRIVHFMNNNGMGSDIHQWAISLCHALEMDATLLTAPPEKKDGNWYKYWIWEDQALCSEAELANPLSCYFGPAKTTKKCDNALAACKHPADTNCVISRGQGAFLKEPVERFCALGSEWTSAAVEYLFSPMDPRVVEAAESAISTVFGAEGIPPAMITVHMRWGDKGEEMDLVAVEDYVEAAKVFVVKHNLTAPAVYLSTEDPAALVAFRAMAPKHWRVYADPMLEQTAATRPKSGNHAVETAKTTLGNEGLHALASVLIAMEAQFYVLTTGSNWSQLIDELRSRIIDPRCGQCTTMVDLRTQDDMCAQYRAQQPAIDAEKPKRIKAHGSAQVAAGTLQRFYNQKSLCHLWS